MRLDTLASMPIRWGRARMTAPASTPPPALCSPTMFLAACELVLHYVGAYSLGLTSCVCKQLRVLDAHWKRHAEEAFGGRIILMTLKARNIIQLGATWKQIWQLKLPRTTREVKLSDYIAIVHLYVNKSRIIAAKVVLDSIKLQLHQHVSLVSKLGMAFCKGARTLALV